MTGAAPDDDHATDGENYRTPGDPRLLAALGRAIWNFFHLESMVASMLYESGQCGSLAEAQRMMAGQKGKALRKLRASLGGAGAPADVLEALDRGIEAFRRGRDHYRNALAHARPFVSGRDAAGRQVLSIAVRDPGGEHHADATELHVIAHAIEDDIRPLVNEARVAVRRFLGI